MSQTIIKQTICIIGAGPAGITAAIALSQKGIPVVIVDKATFPRHKADGDSLTSNVLRALYELSPDMYHRLGKEKVKPLHSFYFNTANGKRIRISLASPANTRLGIDHCYACRRIDFDQFLMEEAKQIPLIQLIENCNLHSFERTKEGGIILYEKTQTLEIHAKLVIVASGANSHFTRTLGNFSFIPKQFAAGLRAYYKNVKGVEEGFTEYVLDKNLMPGGLCLVPMPDGTVCVSMIMRSYEVAKRKINVKEALEKSLHTHPLLKERFKEAELVGEIAGATLHLGVKDRTLAGDNYLMIGDAAGLAEPISANGVGHAMITGMMAAEKAVECIAKQDFSTAVTGDFSKKVHLRLRNSLKIGKIAFLFFNFPRFLIFASNFLTWFSDNDAINELLFSSNIWKTMLKPSFYRKLLFGGR